MEEFAPARRLFMRAEYDTREGWVSADAIAARCAHLAPVTGAMHALIRLLSLREGQRVLDLGCGAGTFAIAAARVNAHVDVVGLDISPGAVDAASRAADASGLAPRVRFAVADFEADALPEADAVILGYALSLAEDPARALVNVRRALRPGGRVVVFDGVLPRDAEPGALDEARLDALAADAGLAFVGRLDCSGDVRRLAAAGEWPWANAPVDGVRFLASGYARAAETP